MSNANGIITAPVDLETDVYKVLGIGKTAKGYDLGYANTNEHGKTNPFSLKKPVRFSKPSTENDPEWYRGDSGYIYGFLLSGGNIIISDLPKFGTIDGLASYSYDPPGSGDWLRLTDWEGYNHNADYPAFIKINQTKNNQGRSAYYVQLRNNPDAELGLNVFFDKATEARIAMIYRTESTLPSNYQFVVSPPIKQWSGAIISMYINSWPQDMGKLAELSIYLTTVSVAVVPSVIEGSNINKITPLIPLIIKNVPTMDYLKTFVNAEEVPEPITIDSVDLLAGPSAPTTWVITFRIHFSSYAGDSQTLDLSKYAFELSCSSWGGYFKFLNGKVEANSIYDNLSGSATASGSGVSAVVAKITYSGQNVPNYIMHSFTTDSVDYANYPKGLVNFQLRRKSDQKVLYSTGINYRNYVPITIS